MIIVGDKVTKINAVRGDLIKGTNIESKPEIKSVTKKELFSAGEKKEGVSIDYSYTTAYGKESSIEIEGSLFLVGETKKLKDLIKNFKKNGKLDENVALVILRRIFEVGMTNSVIISKSMGLPAPIQLPRFVPKK
ncbi:uncharacterized protein METZ01_LOCUS229755 [marine metagenome]|uniref:Uncharacterized protein n=1 Tax=marine metagenome TaxID=408172 RepID=A0A382GRV3_9ZZZZ